MSDRERSDMVNDSDMISYDDLLDFLDSLITDEDCPKNDTISKVFQAVAQKYYPENSAEDKAYWLSYTDRNISPMGRPVVECSRCHSEDSKHLSRGADHEWNYCPYCGARMEKNK